MAMAGVAIAQEMTLDRSSLVWEGQAAFLKWNVSFKMNLMDVVQALYQAGPPKSWSEPKQGAPPPAPAVTAGVPAGSRQTPPALGKEGPAGQPVKDENQKRWAEIKDSEVASWKEVWEVIPEPRRVRPLPTGSARKLPEDPPEASTPEAETKPAAQQDAAPAAASAAAAAAAKPSESQPSNTQPPSAPPPPPPPPKPTNAGSDNGHQPPPASKRIPVPPKDSPPAVPEAAVPKQPAQAKEPSPTPVAAAAKPPPRPMETPPPSGPPPPPPVQTSPGASPTGAAASSGAPQAPQSFGKRSGPPSKAPQGEKQLECKTQ
mmetsp:Transcript_43825/g.103625  ORF Transcript_43825/g.103625 Transcript_43825/m.103625 type:complete len:317 (-) Transcript_43825:136-1086(-)